MCRAFDKLGLASSTCRLESVSSDGVLQTPDDLLMRANKDRTYERRPAQRISLRLASFSLIHGAAIGRETRECR